VISPKEIRFLRGLMDKTQSELATMLRVDDQTVARWEKGKARLPGPADLALRALFLASEKAQPEGTPILRKWLELISDLIERDQMAADDLLFSRSKKGWHVQQKIAA
jgi:transcriptional regulator with XRE-family HTH domain